jgi:pilus assembly protein CpaE
LTSNSVQPGEESGSRAVLICPDAGMSAELARSLANEWPAGRPEVVESYPEGGVVKGLAAKAQVCFLDVASDGAKALEAMARLTGEVPDLPLVVLLRANDPDLILRCIRLGAADFLIQPFTGEQVRAVLAKLARLRTGLSGLAEAGGKVYCVVPGKGACGATTLACNLAFALKRMGGGRVLLADLDGLTGTVAFVLKLKSSYSFMDALGHAGALDRDIWKALAMHSHGVDVLLSPDNPIDCYTEPLDPAALIRPARQAYDAVVLDSGGVHGDWNEGLARLADVLLMVTTNELPAMHATGRALAHLDRIGVGRGKVRMVVNRLSSKAGKLKEAFGNALGAPVFATLPSDYDGIRDALLEGRPSAPASDYGRSVTALARALTGSAKAPKKKGLFSWLRR